MGNYQPCKTRKNALKSSYAYQHDDAQVQSAESKAKLLAKFLKKSKTKRKKS